MRLIDNTPTGSRTSLCHLNKGDQPHEWREMDFPTFSPEDEARGERLRDARVQAGLSLREASSLLGLSVVDLGRVERSLARFAEPADEERALALFLTKGRSGA